MDAVRPDLADIRLAERVFASHYAAALPRALVTDATMRAGRAATAPSVAELSRGDAFELLEVTGGVAWGIAVGRGLVGYLDAQAIGAQ